MRIVIERIEPAVIAKVIEQMDRKDREYTRLSSGAFRGQIDGLVLTSFSDARFAMALIQHMVEA